VTIAGEYLEAQVMTAPPYRLHLLLVEGAIRFLRRGLEALEQERWEEMDAALARARECVAELIGGLAPHQADDLVDRVKSLFAFVYRSVTLGDLQHHPERLRDALRILELHRETWLELAERLQAESKPSAVPSPHTRSWVG
jgi:flagellar protein FliS